MANGAATGFSLNIKLGASGSSQRWFARKSHSIRTSFIGSFIADASARGRGKGATEDDAKADTITSVASASTSVAEKGPLRPDFHSEVGGPTLKLFNLIRITVV